MNIKINKILIIVACIFSAANLFAQQDNLLNKNLYKLKFSSKDNIRYSRSISNDNLYDLKSEKFKVKYEKPSLIKDEKKYKLHPVRFGIVAGGITVGWLGMHIYYSNTWWKDKAHYFKYDNDTYYARNVDKLSHVY